MRSDDKDVSAKNVGVGVKFPSSLDKERARILNKEKRLRSRCASVPSISMKAIYFYRHW